MASFPCQITAPTEKAARISIHTMRMSASRINKMSKKRIKIKVRGSKKIVFISKK